MNDNKMTKFVAAENKMKRLTARFAQRTPAEQSLLVDKWKVWSNFRKCILVDNWTIFQFVEKLDWYSGPFGAPTTKWGQKLHFLPFSLYRGTIWSTNNIVGPKIALSTIQPV